MKRILSILLVVSLMVPFVAYANFRDTNNDSTYGFGGGTHSNTQWNTSLIDLDTAGKTAGTGTFTSRIFDALQSNSWNTIGWTPSRPYLKELPNSVATETAYDAGNFAMTNNVMLLHMNESSGTLADGSGNSNTATKTGSVTQFPSLPTIFLLVVGAFWYLSRVTVPTHNRFSA